MIRSLMRCQVHDPAKGSFLVKIEALPQRHHDRRVYVSSKGTPNEMRFVFIDDSAD